MKKHFVTFARYNRWANARLYDETSRLSPEQYREYRGAFFGSMHGTLSHILVGDRIWMRRMTGEGPTHLRLDEQPYEDFARLRHAREAEDERIVHYVEGLDPRRLEGVLRYHNTVGEACEEPLVQVLAHFFNHQTHHRGQAHALLTELGRPSVVMDLIYFVRSGADA